MSTKLLTYKELKHVNIIIIACKNIEIAINFYLAILRHKWFCAVDPQSASLCFWF